MRVIEIVPKAGLKEDNTTNRVAWRNKINSYTGDTRWRDKPWTKKKVILEWTLGLCLGWKGQ